MQKIAKFEKVSFEQFLKDQYEIGLNEAQKIVQMTDEEMRMVQRLIYNDIKLPVRATIGSAGYDIASTIRFELQPGETVVINTGLRCRINEGWLMMICPRSGLGFKYRATLANTLGIIDEDYYSSDNEGHIKIKLCNDGDKILSVKEGDKIAQGIFLPYGISEDDDVTCVRNGGFGSTGN